MKIKCRNYDWVIMSASSWIPGKPSIEKIIKENDGKGTIMVVEMDGKKAFVLGATGTYGRVNDVRTFIKDTGNGYRGSGSCIIENIINIDENNVINSVNEIGLNEKRTLYVFK